MSSKSSKKTNILVGDGWHIAHRNMKCGFCGKPICRDTEYYHVQGRSYFLGSESIRINNGMVPGSYCTDSCAGQKSWHQLVHRPGYKRASVTNF